MATVAMRRSSHSRSPVRHASGSPEALSATVVPAPRIAHPLENLFSIVSTSLGRMEDILRSTVPVRLAAVHTVPSSGSLKGSTGAMEPPTDDTTDLVTTTQQQRRRVASTAPNVAPRGKVNSAQQEQAAPGKERQQVPVRHGSAPAPGWRSVAKKPLGPSGPSADSHHKGVTSKHFTRIPSGASLTPSLEHGGFKRAAAGGQPPFSATAVRKGFLLRLVPTAANGDHGGAGRANVTRHADPVASPLSPGKQVTAGQQQQQHRRKELSEYRTSKVLSPVERAVLAQPYSAPAYDSSALASSPPPAAPAALVARTPAAAAASTSASRGVPGASVQRHLFGSVSSKGKSIHVPPSATCATSSVSMTSTQWTGGPARTSGGIQSGVGNATHYRRTNTNGSNYLASAVTHSWLSKTHAKGYLMSIIGDQRFRGLSGIAGVSTAHHVVGGANQHHGSRPVSPSHYSRLNSGASQGVLSAPSAASTAVAAGGSAPAGDVDDGTHNDLISTCSALGWTIDELGNFLDKPAGSHHQQQPPNRSYSQHLSQLQLLQQQQQPGSAGDITRCAVLLNRIDEELGRVRAGLGDDEDLLFGSTNPSINKIANGSVSQYPIGAVAAKKKDEATTFTATRKYAQGSIFERLASIGTEAHPLQQHQLTQGGDALLLAPYQRALSATQGSSSNHLNSTHASAHVVRVPPASSVAAPAVAEPANARWVGGLRSEGPTLIARQQQVASASANVGGSSVKKGAKIPLVVQRPTITKTETPPTSIWGRLYAIAEKKQQTTSMTAFQEIQHHVIQPPAAAGNNNGHKLNHAAANSKKPAHAQVNQQQQQQHPKATAALFHRLYEVDTRTKEEARQRKLQEVEAAEQQKVKRERDAIFNRVSRFRETQQFKTQQTTAATSQQQNHRSHSPSSYMHHPQHVSSGAVPPLSPMAPSLFTPSIAITSPNHQQGGGFSRVAATAGGSLGLSPQKSSASTQQQQALRQHAHSWHRAVNSAGAGGGHSDALWHISEDDLIPAPSVEGSPTGHHGIGQSTAPPSSMFLPASTAAGHHPVKYTSKTLPASASHHSRASFETSMNDSHSTLLHTTTSGGNLNFATSINGSNSAAPRRSGKSNNTSPNLRPTAVSLLDDDCDDDDDGAGGSHQLAASFVLTPRGTWQRKQSSSGMHNTSSGIGLTTTQPSTPTPQPPQQIATTSGVGFKTAPSKSTGGKRAPTSPLARSVTPSGATASVTTVVATTTAAAPSGPSNSPFSSSINNNRSNSGRVTMLNETTSTSLNNTTGGDTVSDLLALQPVGSDGGLARSSSAVSGDGGIPRRNSRNGASHIRTSSYVSATPSPQQPQLLPAAAGSNETPSQSSWNNRRAAAGFAQASSSHEAHKRDASADDYEEVPDRRVSAGGVAGLGLSWSHHPHSNAESPDAPHGSDGHPVTMSLLQDEQAAHHEEEHIEKRPAVAKLDFSKLHAMRKQR